MSICFHGEDRPLCLLDCVQSNRQQASSGFLEAILEYVLQYMDSDGYLGHSEPFYISSAEFQIIEIDKSLIWEQIKIMVCQILPFVFQYPFNNNHTPGFVSFFLVWLVFLFVFVIVVVALLGSGPP